MDDRSIEVWFDIPMTTRWENHRTKNRRQCDRCRTPARCNLHQPGKRMEFYCPMHAEVAGCDLGIQPPKGMK